MTALAGVWRFAGAPQIRRSCEGMLKAQSFYARDPPQIWVGDSLALGRALFRTLPEDRFDSGPCRSKDGQRVLVADVRLDNREELATELSIASSTLRVTPDAELLMRALERWGEDAVRRLVGDFAFAFWDQQTRRLLLARDFMGQRPLHYHRNKEFFAFASMPKGLHALGDVPIAPSKQAVAAFLALIPESGTETFFEGIEKVQPGHVLIVQPNAVSARRYWAPPTTMVRYSSPHEYEEALRAGLDQAVHSRLRGAAGRIGAHLSGGLDSSSVAATAARQFQDGGSVIAYTAVPRVGFAGGPSNTIIDEGPLAALVAARYENIEHVKIAASGSSPLERLDRYFYAFERPFLNLCNGVWITAILDDAQARGLPVLLTGQMGNMSFSFDGMAALPQMLREGRLLSLALMVTRLLRSGSRLGTISAQIAGPFLPRLMWRVISQWRGKARGLTDYTLVNPKLELALAQTATERGLDFSYRPRSDPHSMRRWALQRLDQGNYNKGFLGGWGIDVRDPTADRRLVELCLTIPAEQFLAGGVPRSLARRAFADRLPAEICGERRKGYQAADWHETLSSVRGELSNELERSCTIPAVRDLLAIEEMRKLEANWPGTGWHEDRTIAKYRLALLRGTSAAHFVRRAIGSNV